MRRYAAVAFSLVVAAALAGCGERPQVIEYKQGTYQGKSDVHARDTATEHAKWETDIRSRNQAQNEYRRVN